MPPRRTFTVDDYMKAYNVSGVMVLKDGQVVLERYAQGRQPTDRWMSQSVAKSVTSLLYGAAIQDTKLKLTDTVEKFVPELKGSAYESVTIRQLLTMSSGVKWEEGYTGQTSDLAKYYRAAAAGDAVVDFQKTLPQAHPRGSIFHYDTAETHLAGFVLSRAVGRSVSDYLSEKIWKQETNALDSARTSADNPAWPTSVRTSGGTAKKAKSHRSAPAASATSPSARAGAPARNAR
jgi:CubicO group peptidase (beta-lactamase class C family)